VLSLLAIDVKRRTTGYPFSVFWYVAALLTSVEPVHCDLHFDRSSVRRICRDFGWELPMTRPPRSFVLDRPVAGRTVPWWISTFEAEQTPLISFIGEP
jgi:hypothetical protein